MTDRDLLEKAAKAAGIEIHWHTNGTSWAPAADCGAEQLRAILDAAGIEVQYHEQGVTWFRP